MQQRGERDQGLYQRTSPRKVGLELSIKAGTELPGRQGIKENKTYFNLYYPGQETITICWDRPVFL